MKIELAHDFIAKKIYEEASLEDKARARATKFLHERYQHYVSSKKMLLTKDDLMYIRPYIDGMDLDEAEELYIRESKRIIKRTKQMVQIKNAVVLVLFCGIIFSSWGFWEHKRFSAVSKDLATAQDSINILLRNQEKASTTTDIPIKDAAHTSSVLEHQLPHSEAFFSTVKLVGSVKTEQGQPIVDALVQVMGAEAYTKENGRYELYLVLSPEHIGRQIPVVISKTNYESIQETIDSDLPQVDLELIMARH